MTKNVPEAKEKEKPNTKLKVLGVALVIVGIGLILYMVFVGFASDARDDNVSLSQINKEAEENPVVLYFWADGCPPCAQQKPIIEDLEHEYKNKNVTFYWFNYPNHRDLTNHFEVLGTPTTIVINQSGNARKFTGLYDEDEISDAIDNAINTYN